MNDTAIIHDAARQDALGHEESPIIQSDTSRPDATRAYRLTLDQVAHRFEQAGLARSMRTLQRYCASGRLDCLKTDTVAGEQYFVDEHSVERTITELKQLSALTDHVPSQHDTARRNATSEPSAESTFNRDSPRQIDHGLRRDTTRHAPSQVPQNELPMRQVFEDVRHDATQHDMSGQSPALADVPDAQSRPTVPSPDTPRHAQSDDSAKDKIIEMQGVEITFLRQQISVKDEQLKDASERSRETNILIQGLQNMVLTLQAPLGEFTRRLTGEAAPQSNPVPGFPPRQP